jgi:hypothetical protein
MKRIVLIAALTLAASPAIAQSSCPYIVANGTMTAAQWNACFIAKQDASASSASGGAGQVVVRVQIPERVECSPYAGAWPSERRLCR